MSEIVERCHGQAIRVAFILDKQQDKPHIQKKLYTYQAQITTSSHQHQKHVIHQVLSRVRRDSVWVEVW